MPVHRVIAMAFYTREGSPSVPTSSVLFSAGYIRLDSKRGPRKYGPIIACSLEGNYQFTALPAEFLSSYATARTVAKMTVKALSRIIFDEHSFFRGTCYKK